MLCARIRVASGEWELDRQRWEARGHYLCEGDFATWDPRLLPEPQTRRCASNLHLSLCPCPLWTQVETPPKLSSAPSSHPTLSWWGNSENVQEGTGGPNGGFGEYTSVKTTDHKSRSIYNKTDAVKLLLFSSTDEHPIWISQGKCWITDNVAMVLSKELHFEHIFILG